MGSVAADQRATDRGGLVIPLVVLALATLASEDLACIGAGLLIARGDLGATSGIAACTIGIIGGDLLLYALGRWVGRPVARRAPIAWFVRETALERGAAWFAQKGTLAVLVARFIPGSRLPTYLAAGVLHAPFARFAGACTMAALLWVPALVLFSALLGHSAYEVFGRYVQQALIAAVVAIAVYGTLRLLVRLATWRGRRLLLGRWRRLTRWEYWPRWAFYPPVLIYISWLALRYRSLRLITCVNPAMPGGGLVGESKYAILSALAKNSQRVARTVRVAEGTAWDRTTAIRRLMHDCNLPFPIVLKPDVGERGSGVRIVRDETQLSAYCHDARGDILLQPFVPGVEAGLFYYRLPGELQGCLFAITEKRMPVVHGDGLHTLEELILADDRAVCLAPLFLRRHASRLAEIPPQDEAVPLAELGTHCRGAAFFDGSHLRTPALEAAVDEVSRGYPGFWFGRYDVRALSWEALRAGNFTVVELNGATSEATSIYDPRHNLLTAYRTLFRQWAVLFRIAEVNRNAGAAPTPPRDLVALWRRHRMALAGHAAE